jgi:hypothetical protein
MKQIDVLSDDALLEIFDFYVDMSRWAEQSRMSSEPQRLWGEGIERSLGRNGGAIPGVDMSAAPFIR